MKRESERVFFLAAVVDFLLFLQHTRLLLRSIYYTRDYIPGVLHCTHTHKIIERRRLVQQALGE